MTSTDCTRFTSAQELSLKTFDYTEHRSHSIGLETDPDHFFLNNILRQCRYFTEEQFKDYHMIDGTFSVIHFNSRSLSMNMTKIQDCSKKSNKHFSAIAISETWLKDDQGDVVQLEGYDFFSIKRLNKRGGGVALYVKSIHQCDIVKNLSFSLENIMECVTVEIKCEKSKNVIISCVYRAPGSNIDIFKDKMSEMFNSINSNKHLFVCGDFNIDFLNPHNQSQITSFINSVFCMGLYPTITHPSRITVNTATLIDNILTNVTEGN